MKLITQSTSSECKYCGHDEYYTTAQITGTVRFYERYDGKETYSNSGMHDNIEYKNLSKYTYCGNCHKRLFKNEATRKIFLDEELLSEVK